MENKNVIAFIMNEIKERDKEELDCFKLDILESDIEFIIKKYEEYNKLL